MDDVAEFMYRRATRLGGFRNEPPARGRRLVVDAGGFVALPKTIVERHVGIARRRVAECQRHTYRANIGFRLLSRTRRYADVHELRRCLRIILCQLAEALRIGKYLGSLEVVEVGLWRARSRPYEGDRHLLQHAL